MKPKKKEKTYSLRLVSGLVAVCLIATFGFASLAFANSGLSLTEMIAQVAGTIIGNKYTEQIDNAELSLGYVGDSPTYLTDVRPGRLETLTNLFVTTDLEVGGTTYLSGAFTSYATTTLPVNTYYSIAESLDLTGTSTAKGATQNVIAYYTNNGADLIIDLTGIDITGAFTSFEGSFQVGTSTWIGGVEGGSLTTTSSASIIASTTAATSFTTVTNGVIVDNQGWYGSGLLDNKTTFILKNGEVLFATWTPYGATSSASFEASGGFTGAGNMIANARARGN